jgi:hypothetical protein
VVQCLHNLSKGPLAELLKELVAVRQMIVPHQSKISTSVIIP